WRKTTQSRQGRLRLVKFQSVPFQKHFPLLGKVPFRVMFFLIENVANRCPHLGDTNAEGTVAHLPLEPCDTPVMHPFGGAGFDELNRLCGRNGWVATTAEDERDRSCRRRRGL